MRHCPDLSGNDLMTPSTINLTQGSKEIAVPNTHIPGNQTNINTLSLSGDVIKALSIDNLVFGLDNDELKILLVKL